MRRIAAQRVVLATGGFGANCELLAAHIPEMAQAPYFGAPSNTGEGIVWGLEAGAMLAHMAGYQGLGYVVPDHNTRLHPGAITGGGIIVNLAARRFEREDLGYSEWGRVLHGQPGGVGVAIWDEEAHRAVAWTAQMVESQQAGALARCETVGEVAQRFGLDVATLAETLAAHNRAVAEGRDPLGRRKLPKQLIPPYYAARVCGALAHTQGGLRIDLHGRVLRPDGRPVPNLYAGGGSAVGISGRGADGYIGGNGLLAALGLGKLAGDHAATSIHTGD
ncbi:MAG: FAD-binding protein [Chloroflexi bacterium]|nr:FAD-binding protein [Chloroflexota bacterium]